MRRTTDLFVARLTKKLPLPVTTERIAYAAMRACRILAHLKRVHEMPIDRSGLTGPICETYPDASIRQFGLWPSEVKSSVSYKALDPAVRKAILDALQARAPWLAFDGADPGLCLASDDCLDALICALTARAADRGLTTRPPSEVGSIAAVEGWIHVAEDPAHLERLLRTDHGAPGT